MIHPLRVSEGLLSAMTGVSKPTVYGEFVDLLALTVNILIPWIRIYCLSWTALQKPYYYKFWWGIWTLIIISRIFSSWKWTLMLGTSMWIMWVSNPLGLGNHFWQIWHWCILFLWLDPLRVVRCGCWCRRVPWCFNTMVNGGIDWGCNGRV